MFNIRKFDCSTSQAAWETINEFLFLNEKKLEGELAGRLGNSIVSYNNVFLIRKAWVDPEFDFGRMFGYRIQKWRTLVNNYVNLDYLDLVKSDIELREKKKQGSYNVTIHFTNKHDNGKDCLISLTFSRRLDSDVPVLVFNIRASEVTKRLLWDFLLIQRMAEYIYGNNQTFVIWLYCPMMYLNAEAFTMYHTHKNLKKLIGLQKNNLQPVQNRVMVHLKKFQTIDPLSLTYRVHRRSVRQLQTDENGIPLSGDKPLKVKDLQLEVPNLAYPDDCLTDKQRKDYRKKLRNK